MSFCCLFLMVILATIPAAADDGVFVRFRLESPRETTSEYFVRIGGCTALVLANFTYEPILVFLRIRAVRAAARNSNPIAGTRAPAVLGREGVWSGERRRWVLCARIRH